MKKKIVKILSYVVIGVLLTTNSLVFATSDKTKLNNEKSDIQDKIDETNSEIKEVQKEKSSTMQEIEKLTAQISDYETQIDELDDKISNLDESIEVEEEKLKQEQENYEKQQELLKQRLVALYEIGPTSYMDVLLSSEGLTDFISNYYLISEIVEYDTDLLEKIEESKNNIELTKQSLEDKKKQVETAKNSKQQTATALNNSKTTKDKEVSSLSQEEKSLQQQLDQFEKDKKEIEAQLKEIAKKEEEARKKAQEAGQSTNNVVNNPSSSGYIKPVVGYSITTGFNGYPGHTGVDYSGSGISGKPVLAVKDGTVITSTPLKYSDGSYKSYGEYIVISHGDGTMTLYAHGAPGSRMVTEGQTVKQGQQIMKVGTTGNSTGYHLHFEVRVNGRPVNPVPYLP